MTEDRKVELEEMLWENLTDFVRNDFLDWSWWDGEELTEEEYNYIVTNAEVRVNVKLK